MARRNPNDDEQTIRFLAKLSKKGKGMLDPEVAARALGPMGWKFQSEPVALPMTRSDVAWQTQKKLKRCADFFSVENGTLQFWDEQKARCAQQEIPLFAQIVTGKPDRPELHAYYATDPSKITQRGGRYEVHTQIWVGGIGWIVTAPNGKTLKFEVWGAEPLNVASLWTFLYKNGVAEAAKARLDAAGSGVLAKATATKAERERIEMQRSALPEVAAVFRQITDAVYRDVIVFLEEQFRKSTKRVLEIGEDERVRWEKIPLSSSVQRLMESYRNEHGRYAWRPKANYDKLAHAEAVRLADETREAFVLKNTARISEIAKRKGSIPDAKLLRIGEGYGGYGGEISFRFPDSSSFILRNKTVWKQSSGGVTFAQFPTTFHDVKLPDGKKMASPSEARMLDVFAAAKSSNPRRRNPERDTPAVSGRLRQIAARLANGG